MCSQTHQEDESHQKSCEHHTIRPVRSGEFVFANTRGSGFDDKLLAYDMSTRTSHFSPVFRDTYVRLCTCSSTYRNPMSLFLCLLTSIAIGHKILGVKSKTLLIFSLIIISGSYFIRIHFYMQKWFNKFDMTEFELNLMLNLSDATSPFRIPSTFPGDVCIECVENRVT